MRGRLARFGYVGDQKLKARLNSRFAIANRACIGARRGLNSMPVIQSAIVCDAASQQAHFI